MPSRSSRPHGAARARVALLAAVAGLTLTASSAAAQYNFVWADAVAVTRLTCAGGAPAFQDAVGPAALQSHCDVRGPRDPLDPRTGPGPFWEGHAESSNARGVLRASAGARIFANDPSEGTGFVTGGTGKAQAAWHDELTFGPGSVLPAFVDLSMTVHGVLDARVDPLHPGTAGANFQAFLSASAIGAGAQPSSQDEIGRSVSAAAALGCGTCVASEHLEDTWALTVRVAMVGASSLGFDTMLNINAGGGLVTTDVYGQVTGHGASADFSHTAALSGVRFYDALGREITQGVVFTLANGTAIGPAAPAVVPEPGTWALVGLGLVGVVGAARGRRATPATTTV